MREGERMTVLERANRSGRRHLDFGGRNGQLEGEIQDKLFFFLVSRPLFQENGSWTNGNIVFL